MRGVLHESRDQAALFEPLAKAVLRPRTAEDAGACRRRGRRGRDDLAARAGVRRHPHRRPRPRRRRSTLVPEAAAADRARPRGRRAARSPRSSGAARRDLGRRWRRRRRRRRAELAGAGRAARRAGGHDVRRPRRARRPSTRGWSACRRTSRRSRRTSGRPTCCSPSAPTFDGPMTRNWSMPRPPVLVAVNVDARPTWSANYRPRRRRARRRPAGAGRAGATGSGRATPTPPGRAPCRARIWARLRRDRGRRAGAGLRRRRRTPPSARPTRPWWSTWPIPGYWYGGYGRVAGPRRLQYPVGWGTLGYALPAVGRRGRRAGAAGARRLRRRRLHVRRRRARRPRGRRACR